MDAPANLQAIKRAADDAFDLQRRWRYLWQEVADYMMPSRGTFTVQAIEAQGRRRKMLDSTAEEALELLAAGLHGMLTSRSQRWFYLTPEDARLRDSFAVNQWLDAVLSEMYSVINSPKSQFHSQIDQCFMDAGAFGTAILYSQEDIDAGMVYMTRYLGECAIAENSKGIVDSLFRRWKWPVHKVVEEWGVDALPESMKDAWTQGRTPAGTLLQCLHAVVPRSDMNYKRIDAKGMPYASIYALDEHGKVLSESGYRDFPYHVWRWRVRTGETYGSGPGLRLLPDVRMLNEMFKTVMKAAQKAVDPPLWIPESHRGLIRTYPGGINYFDAATPTKPAALESEARMDIGLEMLNEQRNLIRRGMYRDAFDITQDSNGVNVKATFTLQRRDDKFRQLSPVFSSCDSGLLEPTVIRTYNALLRQGRFPPAPPELNGKSLVVRYVSPVARAMRTAEADDILRLIEMANAVGAVIPNTWDNIDADVIVRTAGDQLFNVPAGVIRDRDAVAAFRAARQQQQAQQEDLAQAGQGAEALANVAAASKDFRSAPAS